MAKYRLFVGVGAQRSGTTWLADYIGSLPGVRFSPVKEICYFDSKYIVERESTITKMFNTKLAVIGLGRYWLAHPISGAILSRHYLGMRRLHDPCYRAYFAELTRQGRMAGEISPSYARLGEHAIERMDALLDQPRYFYIMRNPVDRLVSEYSFRLSRKEWASTLVGRDHEEKLTLLAELSPYSSYESCVERYERVIGRRRMHLMFTEALFDTSACQRTCDALCAFLGVSAGQASIDKAVNRRPAIPIPEDVRTRLVRKLETQYRFAQRRFGSAVPDAWRRDIALLGTI